MDGVNLTARSSMSRGVQVEGVLLHGLRDARAADDDGAVLDKLARAAPQDQRLRGRDPLPRRSAAYASAARRHPPPRAKVPARHGCRTRQAAFAAGGARRLSRAATAARRRTPGPGRQHVVVAARGLGETALQGFVSSNAFWIVLRRLELSCSATSPACRAVGVVRLPCLGCLSSRGSRSCPVSSIRPSSRAAGRRRRCRRWDVSVRPMRPASSSGRS